MNMHSLLNVVYFVSITIVLSSADTVEYTRRNFKLTIVNNDPNFNKDTRQKCIDTFFTTMPKMCARFNPKSCSHDARITIDPGYNGVAYTTGNAIVISAKYIQEHPQDTDVITHEGMHIVQHYSRGDPGWLIEGIADYARWKYGVNNKASQWSLPNFDKSQHYTNSYRITARFLVWCEKRYPKIVDQLNTAMRSNTYSNNSWNRFAGGKSVDQLWQDYAKNPAI